VQQHAQGVMENVYRFSGKFSNLLSGERILKFV